MKKNILIFAFLVGLVAPASLLLYATDHPVQRTQGKILILKNDRTLQGKIEREGNRYRVCRDTGELWLPASNVKYLCEDWNEALAVMRSQANLLDADERLRLAKWCEQNELYPQALEEAKRALQMRPKHFSTLQYLSYLEHAAKKINRPTAPSAEPKPLAPAPALDLSADSLSMFTTKVQPILMNACVQCHASGEAGQFKLLRTYGASSNRQHMTQHNMAAVIQQVNLDNPVISPLLVKSVSIHGNATQPPLASRNSMPYQLLKHWVEITIANNPHLRQENLIATIPSQKVVPAIFVPNTDSAKSPATSQFAASSGPKLAATPPRLLPDLSKSEPLEPNSLKPETTAKNPMLPAQNVVPSVLPADARVVNTTPSVLAPVQAKLPVENGTEPNSPASPPQQVDEFDPNIFNRMMHPEKK